MIEVPSQEAMARADAAHDKIEAHEDLCAERYAHIHTAIDAVQAQVGMVLRILAWGGGTLFMILIALIGFLAVRSIDSNDSEIEQLRHQLELLERAIPSRSEEVLRSLRSSPRSAEGRSD